MKRKKKLKLCAFLLSFILIFLSLYFSSNRVLKEFALSNFISAISNVSYTALENVIDDGYAYSDFIIVEKNKVGDINMVITESHKVNEMAFKCAQNAYRELNAVVERGVDIPLGAFSGIRILSGFGAKVNMKLLTVSSVKCDIVSEFQTAGINQTRHVLYLDILATAFLINKISTETVNESIKILIYDNLIVGRVPNVLVSSSVIGSGSI